METLKFLNLYKILSRSFKTKLKSLPIAKIATLNVTFIINYLLFKSKFSSCQSNDFRYLLDYDNVKFKKTKLPKILYLNNGNTYSNDEDKNKIENNFLKIHSKYKDLESYVLDLKKDLNSVSEVEELLKSYGYNSLKDIVGEDIALDDENISLIKEKLLNKPFLFFNKYGDVKAYSNDEFNEISKAETVYNYFERLTILNNKNDLLLLNDYDYVFMIYLDNKKGDYANHLFKIYRKVYFLVNFFNFKFYVVIPEYSNILGENTGVELQENNIYVIKRHNMLSNTSKEKTSVTQKLNIDNEEFEITNISEQLSKVKLNQDDDITKIIVNEADFVYYANSPFKRKQGIEILNLYFKDTPYYLYYTNLKFENNRKKLVEIMNIFKEELNNNRIKENFAFVVVDNEKNVKNALYKTFKQKTFDLKESTMKNATFYDNIPHYEPRVSKKLKLSETELGKENIVKLIAKADITIKEAYFFSKKVLPENFKMLNSVNFDYLINSDKIKIVLIKNKDEKYNRNVMKKVEELAEKHKDIAFFHMYNTDTNTNLLQEKYDLSFDNYPQMVILKDDKNWVFPLNLLLKYSVTSDALGHELLSFRQNNKLI